MNDIDQAIANVDKRIKKLENDMRSLLQEALVKKKAKDTRGTDKILTLLIGAIMALKRKKAYEKELAKLDG